MNLSLEGWSISEFLRKPITTCDFPRGGDISNEISLSYTYIHMHFTVLW